MSVTQVRLGSAAVNARANTLFATAPIGYVGKTVRPAPTALFPWPVMVLYPAPPTRVPWRFKILHERQQQNRLGLLLLPVRRTNKSRHSFRLRALVSFRRHASQSLSAPVSLWKIKFHDVKHRYFEFLLRWTHAFHSGKRFVESQFPQLVSISFFHESSVNK